MIAELLEGLRARVVRHRRLLIAIAAGPLFACATGANTRIKLDDAVQETNVAARFGRPDIAVEHVAAIARTDFLSRHRRWGGELRIVDVEMGGVEKMTGAEATVLVSFGWFRPNEGQLRTTTVRQRWKIDGSDAWWLLDEEQAGGDLGLLDEIAKPGAPAASGASAAVTAPPAGKGDFRGRYETTTIPGE